MSLDLIIGLSSLPADILEHLIFEKLCYLSKIACSLSCVRFLKIIRRLLIFPRLFPRKLVTLERIYENCFKLGLVELLRWMQLTLRYPAAKDVSIELGYVWMSLAAAGMNYLSLYHLYNHFSTLML